MGAVILAALLAAAYAAGWVTCHLRYRRAVAQLAALVDRQQAALTAIPPSAVEHRAEVADDYRRECRVVLDRLDSYHLGRGRAAA